MEPEALGVTEAEAQPEDVLEGLSDEDPPAQLPETEGEGDAVPSCPEAVGTAAEADREEVLLLHTEARALPDALRVGASEPLGLPLSLALPELLTEGSCPEEEALAEASMAVKLTVAEGVAAAEPEACAVPAAEREGRADTVELALPPSRDTVREADTQLLPVREAAAELEAAAVAEPRLEGDAEALPEEL